MNYHTTTTEQFYGTLSIWKWYFYIVKGELSSLLNLPWYNSLHLMRAFLQDKEELLSIIYLGIAHLMSTLLQSEEELVSCKDFDKKIMVFFLKESDNNN